MSKCSLLVGLFLVVGVFWVSVSSNAAYRQITMDPNTFPPDPPIDLIVDGDLHDIEISPLSSNARRIVPGFFSKDGLLDLMVHDGSSAALLYGAEIFSCSWHASFNFSDVCGYRSPVEERVRRLAVATDTGLRTWAYGTGGVVTSVPVGTSAWVNAHSLEAGNCFSSPEIDVVGISTTGQILVLQDISSEPTTDQSFSCPSPPLELVLVDWDSDGLQEIAVRAEAGLYIYEADGTLITSFGGYHPQGALAKVQLATMQALVWVTPGPLAGFEFLTLLMNGAPPVLYQLGVPQTESIAGGDLNGDGFVDLVLRQGGAGDLLLLLNTGTGFLPDDPNYSQVIPGVPGDGAQGKPLFVDIEQDGDLDLMWGVAGGSKLRMIRSAIVDDAEFSPDLREVRFDLDGTTGQAYLKFEFFNADSIPDGYTHLHVSVFRKESPTGETASTAQGSFLHEIVVPDPPASPPIPPGGNPNPGNPTQINLPEPWGGGGSGGNPSPYPSWQVFLEETTLEFPAIYAVVLRYVTVADTDTGSEVVSSAPARVLLFTPELEDGTQQPSLEYLLELSQSEVWFLAIPDVATPPAGHEVDLIAVGTLITTKPIPDLKDDEEPDFGTGSTGG